MDRYEMSLGKAATVRPEVLDNYDWDEAERERAELLGVPKKLTVDIEKRDEMRAQRAQAAQQAEQKAMMAGMAGMADKAMGMVA
jgi:CRISPR/Cas system-associated protein Csm6